MLPVAMRNYNRNVWYLRLVVSIGEVVTFAIATSREARKREGCSSDPYHHLQAAIAEDSFKDRNSTCRQRPDKNSSVLLATSISGTTGSDTGSKDSLPALPAHP